MPAAHRLLATATRHVPTYTLVGCALLASVMCTRSPSDSVPPDPAHGATEGEMDSSQDTKPTAGGTLDKDEIRVVVRERIGQVTDCYNAGLAKDASLSGRVTIRFVIAGNGHVSSAKIESNELDGWTGRRVAKCIASTIKSAEFPKPQGGGDVLVTYPFNLTADDSPTQKPTPNVSATSVALVREQGAREISTPNKPMQPAGLSADDINAVVRTNITEVRRCYQHGLAIDEYLAGSLDLVGTISGSGRLESIDIVDNELAGRSGDAVANCIREVAEEWQFAEPRGGTAVQFVYPLTFEPR